MSKVQITLSDDEGNGAVDVEVACSDNNPESPSVILGVYMSQNWDTIVAACKRHLVLRQAALEGIPGAMTADQVRASNDDSALVESAPKILNASGTGVLSSED